MSIPNEAKPEVKALGQTKDLAARVLSTLIALPITPQDVFLKVFMISLFAKALKSYQAIETLWLRGFPEDALILSRSLFETMIQTLYVARQPEVSVQQVILSWKTEALGARIAFDQNDVQGALLSLTDEEKGVEALAKLKRRVVFRIACPQAPQEKVDWLNRELDAISREVEFSPTGWWGHNIRWLAEQVGFSEFYRTFYLLLSHLAHSHPVSLEFYRRECSSGIEFLAWPDVQHAEQNFGFIPALATRLLLNAAEALDKAFGLNMKKDIDEVKAVLTELAN